MSDNIAKNKRIARNTIFLYLRTLFTMLVALYTSRVVLGALGIVDYGVYNVVGGISLSFVFLSSSLSNATHRYLNFAIGKNDSRRLGQIFNQNLLIYFAYAVASVLLIEIAGGWLLNRELTIPDGRMDAARWILHTTSVSLFVTIIGSVYESVLISRENMKVYAYLGMYDALLKLAVAFVVSSLPYDKLKLFALLATLAIISSRFLLILYASRRYEETALKFYWDKKLFKEMFRFSGWNLLDASVYMLNDQGINILLNMFFGPAVNAARGVSVQVKSAVTNFSASIVTAIRPQIVKSYASGDIEYFKSLLFSCGKYSFFLLWIIALPVMLRIGSLLDIWLEDVPDRASEFIVWMLVFSLVNTLCDSFWQGIQAVGRIGKYVVLGNLVYLMAFPASWFAFRMGGDPVLAYQIIAFVRLLYLVAVYKIFKGYVNVGLVEYIRRVLYPIFKVVSVSLLLAFPLDAALPQGGFMMTLASCLLLLFAAFFTILFMGIGPDERKYVLSKVKGLLCKA